MGEGHPECPQRLDAINDRLIASGVDLALDWRDSGPVDPALLAHAHSAGYLAEIGERMRTAETEVERVAIDPDTYLCQGSRQAALMAAGAAVAAVDAVLDGTARNAFCAIRPPGHHATRDASMGFCFYNNVCVAARHALDDRGLSRVAIIDFDVHHGNGTEDIVANDERVLMCSFFQHPLYPYNGAVPLGTNMVNVPVPAYTRGPAVRELIEAQWLPALREFRPELILISAGFDAHREDDMGQMGLVEADYAWITAELVAVADECCGGRIVSCLEGGYALSALGRSVVAHLRVLTGLDD